MAYIVTQQLFLGIEWFDCNERLKSFVEFIELMQGIPTSEDRIL